MLVHPSLFVDKSRGDAQTGPAAWQQAACEYTYIKQRMKARQRGKVHILRNEKQNERGSKLQDKPVRTR
jgi:hypothetical protein